MAKRRIEITVETERIVITGTTPGLVWCEHCQEQSFEVSLEQSAVIAQAEVERLRLALQTGLLHHWQGGEGSLRICLRSLAAAFTSP